MVEFIYGNVRIQLLSEDVIRLESGKKGEFCDKNTFLIPNKSNFEQTQVAYTEENGVICFGEYELYIPQKGKTLSGIHLEKNGKKVYTYKKLSNSGELPPLDKTPEVFAISDTPRIIIPEGGYSAKRNGNYKVTENLQDIYLLLCGKDAKKLRKLYVELTGRSELVRLSVLGCWNSKYYAYTEESAKKLISDYETNDLPLDNMVIDTDWRSCKNGWGYDINTELFPDMKRFLDFAHDHGVEIMFNDHPEPVKGTESVFSPEEIDYREKNLQAIMALGVDTWWYDRNWHIRLLSASDNIRSETFGLYLFEDITRNFYQKQSGSTEIYRRPVIMGNVVNIENGKYVGITDSASHRYSVQWTGDIPSESFSLDREINTLLRASENCVAYVNADCGGHMGNPDKEMFVRWIQFGTLSPVFRPHCTNAVRRTRDPWAYDEETLSIFREYVNLRYRLLPVFYRCAYESYSDGTPICRRLYWEYPNDKRAKKNDSYLIGNDILIKPIIGSSPVNIPEENYVSPVKATYFNGREWQGSPVAMAEYSELNMILDGEPPEEEVPIYDFSARFETEVRFEKDVKLFVCIDDGATVWIDGEKIFEDKTLHSARSIDLKTVTGGESHKIRIDYFQAGDKACCILQYTEANKSDSCEIYLPSGKWLDVFDGKTYRGGKKIKKEYDLRKMPIFIRCGALIPLAYESKNTKEQKWNELVFDFYPDKEGKDCGYLYEDDTETTAYKQGQFRKCRYEAFYCADCNAFVVKLHAAEGEFDGEKAFNSRKIMLKYHLSKGLKGVKNITVNGENCSYVKKTKNGELFPFNTKDAAPDGAVICTSIEIDVDKEYEIKFYL